MRLCDEDVLQLGRVGSPVDVRVLVVGVAGLGAVLTVALFLGAAPLFTAGACAFVLVVTLALVFRGPTAPAKAMGKMRSVSSEQLALG